MSFTEINFILMNIRNLFADAFVSNLGMEGHIEQWHAKLKAPGKHEKKVKQKQRKQFSSLYTEP